MASQKVVVAKNDKGEMVVTTKDAVALDILGTAVSLDSAVTGFYGLAQKAAIFAGGMMTQEWRRSGSLNFL